MKNRNLLCMIILIVIIGIFFIGCSKQANIKPQESSPAAFQKSEEETKTLEAPKVEAEVKEESKPESVIGSKYTLVALTLRSDKGTDYPKITVIPQNTKIDILNNADTWFKVKYDNKIGYVNSKYLSDNIVKVEKAAEKPAPPKESIKKEVVIDIPYLSQYEPVYAPMGCEGTSLLMALKYKTGTSVGLKQFLDEMPKDPTNPFKGFAATPYEIVKGVFQSIFPEPLTAYGSKYGKVANISGNSADSLKREIDNGNPVVVYVTTRNFEYPKVKVWNIEGVDYNIVDNMHVMVLTGYNSNGEYHVTDPANSKKKYWVSKSKFETAYNVHKWAVVVR